MKVTCKIRPEHSTCSECIDIQMEYGESKDCAECPVITDEYELLDIKTSFWHKRDYALVLKDGLIQKVPLRRIYNVKERRNESK